MPSIHFGPTQPISAVASTRPASNQWNRRVGRSHTRTEWVWIPDLYEIKLLTPEGRVLKLLLDARTLEIVKV